MTLGDHPKLRIVREFPFGEEPPGTALVSRPVSPVDPLIGGGAIAITAVGIAIKKHDGFSAPEPLLPFPPYGPSTHELASQTPVPGSFNVNGSQSFTGGGFLGYNKQFGNVVVGIEGDFAWKKFSASNSQTVISTATYGPACFGVGCNSGAGSFAAQRMEMYSGQIGQDWDASLRARLGTLITPSTLLYLTGGPAAGRVSGAFSFSGKMNQCGYVASTSCATPADLTDLLFTQSTTGAGSWSETGSVGQLAAASKQRWRTVGNSG